MELPNKVEESQLSDYRKAGKIAAIALHHGASMMKPGARIVDILDAVEEKIAEFGVIPAFPAQMSRNTVAAHFCPVHEDKETLEVGDCVKIDVGVHVNGCVGDNALTVDLSEEGKWAELCKASKDARDAAIKSLHPDITPNEIGTTVQEVITSHGFEPIRNLCGHGVAPFQIHTKPSIPSYPNNDQTKIPENHVIAIEPFATTGEGLIKNGDDSTIFMQVEQGKPRSQMAREVLKEIQKHQGLPFTTRWISRVLGEGKTRFGLKELLQYGIIADYPPLPEQSGGWVAQFENTILIKDKPEIFTKLPED